MCNNQECKDYAEEMAKKAYVLASQALVKHLLVMMKTGLLRLEDMAKMAKYASENQEKIDATASEMCNMGNINWPVDAPEEDTEPDDSDTTEDIIAKMFGN